MATAIVSIGCEITRPKDRTGSFVNEGIGIPIMRGRKDADPVWMIKELEESLISLSESQCTFWACQGPTKPRNMLTCNKCWAMRQIANVKRTLERSSPHS